MTQSYYPWSKKQQTPSPGVMEKPTDRTGSYSTPQLLPSTLLPTQASLEEAFIL